MCELGGRSGRDGGRRSVRIEGREGGRTNHEEIGCFGTLSTYSEEFYEVEELAVNVSTDLRRRKRRGR